MSTTINYMSSKNIHLAKIQITLAKKVNISVL